MTDRKITISGTGSALVDYLYSGVDFNSPAFQKYMSRTPGDGGLHPGRLVFASDLERFAGKHLREILPALVKHKPDASNIGGPAVVSLIQAAQMLNSEQFDVRFYGAAGDDETGNELMQRVQQTPLDLSHYRVFEGEYTPFTDVLSDPNYHDGAGERTFINNIGAAWQFKPEFLDDAFFNSDIVTFGGTALVPHLHDHLTHLLQKAKANNCLTVVNTVFDFRNEQKNPGKKWPLGIHHQSFPHIDLLLMDQEEALKISGKGGAEEAAAYFQELGVGAFAITRGSETVLIGSNGKHFSPEGLHKVPVSEKVVHELRQFPEKKGDTTGCGDNFAGGVLASLAWQLAQSRKTFSLREMISWGIASGGYACFYVGGTFIEEYAGQKRERIKPYVEDYQQRIQAVLP